jgi:hypothetical protein
MPPLSIVLRAAPDRQSRRRATRALAAKVRGELLLVCFGGALKLLAPGSRNGNPFWLLRGSLRDGRRIEFSTKTSDRTRAVAIAFEVAAGNPPAAVRRLVAGLADAERNDAGAAVARVTRQFPRAAKQCQRNEYHKTRHVFSSARATATKVESQPRLPTIDRPTGKPSTVAPGMLICGTPVSPPWQQRQSRRSRCSLATDSGSPRLGAGKGVVGKQRIVPSGSR